MGGVQYWMLLGACLYLVATAEGKRKVRYVEETSDYVQDDDDADDSLEPCQCGVFLSLQVGVKQGSRRAKPRGPPQGDPVVTYDNDSPSMPCGHAGFKNCINRCLDVMTKYLPKAGSVICGSVDRDVHRERAFLFVRNCDDSWRPTSFTAGKEFCCADGEEKKC